MLRTDKNKIFEYLNAVLNRNTWGTIGNYSVAAAKSVVDRAGIGDTHSAVLCDSAYAAMETILRGYFLGHGDKVIVPALSSPYISMTCATVGCEVIFADVEKGKCTVSADCIAALLSREKDVKAVICEDLLGYACDIGAISGAIAASGCGAKLFVCTPDVLNVKYDSKPTVFSADAAVATFDASSAIDADCAAVISKNDYYDVLWSAHHCGNARINGTYEALNAGTIAGGDMRVCEWKSAVLLCELESFASASPVSKTLCFASCEKGEDSAFVPETKPVCMNRESAFLSDYYVKETGAVRKVYVCPAAESTVG